MTDAKLPLYVHLEGPKTLQYTPSTVQFIDVCLQIRYKKHVFILLLLSSDFSCVVCPLGSIAELIRIHASLWILV